MGLLQTISNSHENVQGLQTIGNIGKVLWGTTCIIKEGFMGDKTMEGL